MPLPEGAQPVRMQRVALVAPADALRDTLVRVADAGIVELDRIASEGAPAGDAGRAVQRLRPPAAEPLLAPTAPDLAELERSGRSDLLAGEAELEEYAGYAVRRGSVAALAGWCPAPGMPVLTGRLAEVGAAVVPLPAPRGVDPPTLLTGGGPVRRSFGTLVDTYGTVPYPDIDPTLLAGVAYVLMFGMMFGDVGHGLLLLAVAAALRAGRPRRLSRLRAVWPFVAGAGLAAAFFGALYGEFFGPTGAVPVLWLEPLAAPVRLLAAAVGLGALLLAVAYGVAIVNRWREGGPRLAAYASSGFAGAALFAGLGCLAGGLYLHHPLLSAVGGLVAAAGLGLAAVGFYAGSPGGTAGGIQAGVELFDAVLRLGANLVSFARLAAFGLTHAALGWLVWRGTSALAGRGWAGVLAAAAVFVAGNLLAFCLEALVAGVQALRLEFYELFSRVFAEQGRPFRPWRVRIAPAELTEEDPCSPR